MAKSKLGRCEFACPSRTYDGHVVTSEAVLVLNPNFVFRRADKSGCQMKAFNDGAVFPRVRVGQQGDRPIDISCTGVGSEACPKEQGFGLVKHENSVILRKVR